MAARSTPRFLSVAAILFALALGGEARAADPAAGDAPAQTKKKQGKKKKSAKADEAAALEKAAAEAAEAEAPLTALGELLADPDPEAVALAAELDDDTRDRLDAISPEQLESIFAKLDNGEALSPDEAAIQKGFFAAVVRKSDRQLSYQHGDVSISDGMATLHLGDELRFLAPAEAKKVFVDAWGNPPDPAVLGMIVPKDTSPLDPDRGWGVLVTFSADGYVEDDDAEDLDYDELLEDMQKGTEEGNADRVRQGYSPLHLLGWAEPPHYDGETHRLYWAQKLATDESPEPSLNYAIRVLGRKGVLELNAVAPMPMLAEIKPAMEQVMTQVEFEAGHRYEDFNPDIDEVAAYGIGGLIAGKVLLKTGILAGLLKFLLVAKKFLIVGVVALGAGIKAWFSRKKAE
jgi:uncharacterized membrane-anchored protein